MIGRILWAATCAALAFVTAQIQLDREAARKPGYAAMVLELFRANAQFVRTARALYRQDSAGALDSARTLIVRRPIPSEHLTLLAGAYFQRGEMAPAALAAQYAAQRGWRDSVAQEARLRLALEAGDTAEAARRFVALLINPPTDTAALAPIGRAVFSGNAEDAETVVVELVSGTDRWNANLLSRGVTAIPAPSLVRVIARGLGNGAKFDCGALARTVKRLSRSDPASAESLQAAIAARCGA